jgi:hypothetical protein
VFVEILNLHSHSDRDITISIKEDTDNYLLIETNYIVDVASVMIQSYSDSSTSALDNANLYFKDSDVDMFDFQTIFNIIENTNIDVASIIINSEDIDDSEVTTSKSIYKITL